MASSLPIPSSTRRATVTPADPGATTTNSSPPVRATVSTSRTVSASTAATWRRTWSPAREPDASLSAVKPSTSNIATETSLPWRCARATSSSRTRPSVRPLDSPVSGSVCATRSNHSARSVAIDEVRNEATAAAARSATATSRVSSAALTSCSPSHPYDSTPTHASASPLATTSGRSANVTVVPAGETHVRPSDPVRSSAALWIGCAGSSATIDLEPGSLVVGHAERQQQLEPRAVRVVAEQRGDRGADGRGPGLHDQGQGAVERRSIGRAPPHRLRGRSAGRRRLAGYRSRVSPCAAARRDRPAHRRHPSRECVASRHRTPPGRARRRPMAAIAVGYPRGDETRRGDRAQRGRRRPRRRAPRARVPRDEAPVVGRLPQAVERHRHASASRTARSTRSSTIVRENCNARTQIVNPMPPIMEPGEFFMPYPLEVEVGGATVFVLPVERFERL